MLLKSAGQGFHAFSTDIATLVNSILLSIVYVSALAATALAAKLVGKRFLERRILKAASTYWNDAKLGIKDKEHYYRQF